MIKKICNPYIPDEYNGSLGGCGGGTTCSNEVPRAWLSRYTEVEINDNLLLREDITGAYTPQGGCVHNGYIYRALVKADEEPAKIQKIDISTGKIVKETQYTCGHANDLFVKEGYLYILHSSSTNIVYQFTLDLDFMAVEKTGPTRWGQAYNSTDGVDVIGNVGSAYFSVYKDGIFLFRIKPDNAFSGMVRQGLFCDDNYIGVSLDNAYGAVIENELGSRIMFYTWNGMFIKSVHIPIAEIEWSDYVDGKLYVGTYDGRDPNDVKSGKIYVIPFDLYPEQTVQTGRPTDVSGGFNNLHRLPEGTHVKLWQGTASEGVITLLTASTRLQLDEDGPFRYLIFEFDGANANSCIWWPKNNGVPILREFDITAAEQDSNLRFREMRLTFNVSTQQFTIASNLVEQLLSDVSEKTLTMTKSPDGLAGIKLRSIWGVV